MDNHEIVHNAEMTPPAQDQAPAAPEPEPTPGQWLARNGPLLAIMGALIIYLYVKFDSEGLWAIAKAALGLSFVVFIHELGHFLVAKWCDVHVTTFSIGFGPALPGCSFQWGETTYKLALFPLGGYVQMVGQVDGDESSDGNEDDPRSYRNKSVWQRMAIISAGVVMNVILAIICFVIVFQGPGKNRPAAVIAAVDSESPAFKKGLRTGAEILQIGDVKHPHFENLMVTVMSTGHGQHLPIVFQRPGDKEATALEIEPMLSKVETRPMIGISPAHCLELASRRDLVDPSIKHPVWPYTVAAKTERAFQFGDRIIATTDPDDPAKIKDLPLDPRKPNSKQRDYFEFARRMQLLAGQEVTLRVERGPENKTEAIDIKVPPAFHYTFGARMQIGQIVALREGSPAAKAGVRAREKGMEGDVIYKVEVREPDGKTITRWGDTKPLDPVRLPFDLKQWAARVSRAKSKPSPEDRKVILHVATKNNPRPDGTRELVWDDDWRFDMVQPMKSTSPLAIPELGLAYQVTTTVAHVERDEESNPDGLRKYDVIKKVRIYQLDEDGEKKEGKWVELEPEEFGWVFWTFQFPLWADSKFMTVQVERLKDKSADKEVKEIEIEAKKDRSWPLAERGLVFARDVRLQKAADFFQAVALGLQDTYDSMVQVYQNLRGMITGRISVKNLGGPVTIARVAYRFAGYDFWEFLFFIGLISVNLAVINFLPIPVLDGGHMVFLIYEKIRGKPASEGIRIGATYAGLALILTLMVFVLYLDISRIFGG